MIHSSIKLAPILVLVAGCFHHRAHDVTARIAPATPASGAIDVVLQSPTREMTVAVDGALAVDRAHSRKAHIEGVPAGPAHVQVAVGGRCEHGGMIEEDVAVAPGITTTIVLPGPDRNHVCMAATTAVHVALALLLIRPAFHLAEAIRTHIVH